MEASASRVVHLQHCEGTTPTPTSRRKAIVAAATASLAEPVVLDLGANDGRFSAWRSARRASLAIAVDGDHLVVDHLYCHLRSEGGRILPLVMDLSDPSPGLGWRGRERPSFIDRVRPDLVLCRGDPPPGALRHGSLPRDRAPSTTSRRPGRGDAPSRRSDGGPAPRSEASRPVRPLPTPRGRPRCGSGSRSTSSHLPSGTRTLYRCRPR